MNHPWLLPPFVSNRLEKVYLIKHQENEVRDKVNFTPKPFGKKRSMDDFLNKIGKENHQTESKPRIKQNSVKCF